MRPFAHGCAVLMLLVGGSANAATINMFVGNMDVTFDGVTGQLHDLGDHDGGNLDESESRPVSSTEFEVDGVSQVILMDPPDEQFADLLVTNLGSELTINSLEMNQGGTGSFEFGFDWFTDDGDFLQLGIDDISYTIVETGVAGLNFFNLFASAKVLDQSLPDGLAFVEDVLFSYTSTDVMLSQGQGGGARLLLASGSATVTGDLVPEPTAGYLLLASLAGSVVALRYRFG